MSEIPAEYEGWWRITETSQWEARYLDLLGPALLSLTGVDDRLRMHCLLATVSARPTKTGVSFSWQGAWEFDEMSGTVLFPTHFHRPFVTILARLPRSTR